MGSSPTPSCTVCPQSWSCNYHGDPEVSRAKMLHAGVPVHPGPSQEPWPSASPRVSLLGSGGSPMFRGEWGPG